MKVSDAAEGAVPIPPFTQGYNTDGEFAQKSEGASSSASSKFGFVDATHTFFQGKAPKQLAKTLFQRRKSQTSKRRKQSPKRYAPKHELVQMGVAKHRTSRKFTLKKNVINNDALLLKHVPAIATNVDPFQPLLVPLSGVDHILFLQKGKKKVLLIGETHQQSFFGDKGYVPLSRIIVDYLQNVKQKVDFMFEVDETVVGITDTPEYVTEIASRPENTSDLHILNQVRILLKSYVRREKRFPNARVHYLDKEKFRDGWLKELTEGANDDEIIFKTDDEQLFQELFPNLYKVLGVTKVDGTEVPDVKRMLELTLESWPFTKCRTRHKAMMPIHHYVRMFHGMNAFVKQDGDDDFKTFLFTLHRIIMDMYTSCRILRNEDGWYNNIIVYAGALHTYNMAHLLNSNGYSIQKYDITPLH